MTSVNSIRNNMQKQVLRISIVLLAFSVIPLLGSCATSQGLEKDSGKVQITDSSPAGKGRALDGEPVFTLPEQSLAFWSKVMTPEIANRYRAINGRTKCTMFIGDMLRKHLGQDVFLRVFPDGIKGSNETFVDWTRNSSLIRLSPGQYSIADIQKLADNGYLILMAYYYPKIAGHVAFIGHNGLTLFTIPPISDLEGMDGNNLRPAYLPVVVQAGTYTGITSMVYATNGWLRNDNFGRGIVRYYAVRKDR